MDSFDSVRRLPRDVSRLRENTTAMTSVMDADEELIRTAQVATHEADCSQREVDRWRLDASVQAQRVTDLRRRKELLLREVAQLRSRIEEEDRRQQKLEEDQYRVRFVERSDRDDTFAVLPGTFAASTSGHSTEREVELHYMMSRAIAALDEMQAEVTELRHHHADLWHHKRQTQEDVARLQSAYEKLTQRCEELQQQQLFIRALEADPMCRRAIQSQQELENVSAEADVCRVALRQCRSERAAVIAHVLNGAEERWHRTRKAHEKLAGKKGFSDHPMYPMLLQLQEENSALHVKYMQLVRGNEEEDAALVDYLDVLNERLVTLLKSKTGSSHDNRCVTQTSSPKKAL